MNSKALMNGQRIKALGLIGLLREREGVLKWGSAEFGGKFLVIDGVLVVGPINDHSEVYAAYRTWELPLEEAVAQVRDIANRQWQVRDRGVTAAGSVDSQGKVTAWTSTCFGIDTRAELRPEIEACLQQLWASGEMNPR